MLTVRRLYPRAALLHDLLHSRRLLLVWPHLRVHATVGPTQGSEEGAAATPVPTYPVRVEWV